MRQVCNRSARIDSALVRTGRGLMTSQVFSISHFSDRMRQEALKRHLKRKSFPITSIKNTSPSGRRLTKTPRLKALIKPVF